MNNAFDLMYVIYMIKLFKTELKIASINYIHDLFTFYNFRNPVRGYHADQCGRLRQTRMYIETKNDCCHRDQTHT